MDSVLFLVSGLVSLWVYTDDNRSVLMGIIGPGSILGGMPNSGETGKVFTAVAFESLSLLCVPKAFAKSLEKNSLEYCQFLNRVLAKHFLKAAHIIKRERSLSRKQRLYDIILELLNVCKTSHLPVTQEQLASMTGCSRTALIDELKSLERESVIVRKYGKIEIIDSEKLECLVRKKQPF